MSLIDDYDPIEIPTEEIIEHIKIQQESIRSLKMKLQIELLGSSFLLLFTYSIFLGRIYFSYVSALAAMFPVIVNAIAWVMWAVSSRRGLRLEDRNPGRNYLFREYESSIYTLSRLERLESYIDLLTALQLIMLAIVVIFGLVFS